VQRREALVVALVDLGAVVEQVVDLRAAGRSGVNGAERGRPCTPRFDRPRRTMSSCRYVVAKWIGAPAPLSWVMK
jgi:hypothetical protein